MSIQTRLNTMFNRDISQIISTFPFHKILSICVFFLILGLSPIKAINKDTTIRTDYHMETTDSNEKNTIKKSDIQGNRISVKVNSLLALSIINPAVEFRVSEKLSVQMEAIGIFHPHGFRNNGYPITLATSFGELRYYPKEVLRGFYCGGNIGWGVYRMSKGAIPFYKGAYKTIYQVGSCFMAGVSVGYNLRLTDHWFLDFSLGGGYQNSYYEAFYHDGTQYIGLNESAEWLPYKGGISVVYSF